MANSSGQTSACAQREAGYQERIQALEKELYLANMQISLLKEWGYHDTTCCAAYTTSSSETDQGSDEEFQLVDNSSDEEQSDPMHSMCLSTTTLVEICDDYDIDSDEEACDIDERSCGDLELDDQWDTPESQVPWSDGTLESDLDGGEFLVQSESKVTRYDIFCEPSSHCRISATAASSIIDRAMRSASKIVYHALDHRKPETCFSIWDSPESVFWSRAEMKKVVIDLGLWERNQVQETVNKVFDARNAWAHPDIPRQTRSMHKWLSSIEELGTLFREEQEVDIVRALKAELMTEAVHTWDEIVAIENETDGHREWSKPARRTLYDLCDVPVRYDVQPTRVHARQLLNELERLATDCKQLETVVLW